MALPKSFKTIEIMQQCKYGFTLDYVEKLLAGWNNVKHYAYILHDKDKKPDGTDKEPHIHLMLRFLYPEPTSNLLKKLEGVCEVQHLEKMKNWNSAIAYLTHSKEIDKHKYADEEVKSNYEWQVDRDQALLSGKKVSEIISLIEIGEIRPFNLHEYITIQEYNKYKRDINNAFEYIEMRENGKVDREMQVVFITGESGSGKTTYARENLCKGKSYYVSDGGKNPLDGYLGQDVVILDDLRACDYQYSELLKLLDNHTSSKAHCRYYNKSMRWCKMIIITSVLPLEDWYMGLQEHQAEPLLQLKRRCTTYLTMTSKDIVVRVFDPVKKDYEELAVIENPVAEKYKKESARERQIEMVSGLLGVDITEFQPVKVNSTEWWQEKLNFKDTEEKEGE